ncbi:MAG: hypothetical protein JWO58_2137 [Chitinophagaceae bacterium]|nr:hypothetical protein [Chitinophagaceae bacterium]
MKVKLVSIAFLWSMVKAKSKQVFSDVLVLAFRYKLKKGKSKDRHTVSFKINPA